jgi:hypothetical protein
MDDPKGDEDEGDDVEWDNMALKPCLPRAGHFPGQECRNGVNGLRPCASASSTIPALAPGRPLVTSDRSLLASSQLKLLLGLHSRLPLPLPSTLSIFSSSFSLTVPSATALGMGIPGIEAQSVVSHQLYHWGQQDSGRR